MRGSTAHTLRGDLPVPRVPPSGSLDVSIFVIDSSRDQAQRFVFAFRPEETSLSSGHHRAGDTSRPCTLDQGISLPGPGPVFRHRHRPKGDFGSPFWNSIDRDRGDPGEETARRRKAGPSYRVKHVWTTEEETRSPNFLSPAFWLAWRIPDARFQLRSFH